MKSFNQYLHIFHCERKTRKTQSHPQKVGALLHKKIAIQSGFWNIDLCIVHQVGEQWSLLYLSFVVLKFIAQLRPIMMRITVSAALKKNLL